jgi:hypothetical protein
MAYNRYRRYMQSKAWRVKKAKYWKSKYPKCCYVCGAARHPRMHLHHRTYVRLGKERLSDLVPVCESCHQYIHDYHKNSKLTLEAATTKCRNALKNKHKVIQRTSHA